MDSSYPHRHVTRRLWPIFVVMFMMLGSSIANRDVEGGRRESQRVVDRHAMVRCQLCGDILEAVHESMLSTPRGADVKATYARKGRDTQKATTAAWAHDVLEHTCDVLFESYRQDTGSLAKKRGAEYSQAAAHVAKEFCPSIVDDFEDEWTAYIVQKQKQGGGGDTDDGGSKSPCEKMCKGVSGAATTQKTAMEESIEKATRDAKAEAIRRLQEEEDAKNGYIALLFTAQTWREAFSMLWEYRLVCFIGMCVWTWICWKVQRRQDAGTSVARKKKE